MSASAQLDGGRRLRVTLLAGNYVSRITNRMITISVPSPMPMYTLVSFRRCTADTPGGAFRHRQPHRVERRRASRELIPGTRQAGSAKVIEPRIGHGLAHAPAHRVDQWRGPSVVCDPSRRVVPRNVSWAGSSPPRLSDPSPTLDEPSYSRRTSAAYDRGFRTLGLTVTGPDTREGDPRPLGMRARMRFGPSCRHHRRTCPRYLCCDARPARRDD